MSVGYDNEPRDYSKPVLGSDIRALSSRLTAAGIESGVIMDVSSALKQPGLEVIEPEQTAHVFHRPEPAQVHFAIGVMAAGAPAAAIEHTILSDESRDLFFAVMNQAAFNKLPKEAAAIPGFPSSDVSNPLIQRHAGEAAWLLYDKVAHFIHIIEQTAR
ncbi:MAG TPA: hypothetical protein VLF43_03330 [Candidatus Saccharimonadales bacterium]|nr:hypothetical protein [Candidatus Saccharimonadales bacterium]